MRVKAGVYFSHIDFVAIVYNVKLNTLVAAFNHPVKVWRTWALGAEFLIDAEARTITRTKDNQVHKITKITEFWMDFVPFKM